jgi:hypothetical protein
MYANYATAEKGFSFYVTENTARMHYKGKEHWWNYPKRGKLKYCEKNLF